MKIEPAISTQKARIGITICILALILGQHFALASPTYACSCITSSFEDSFTNSAAVFLGTVTNTYSKQDQYDLASQYLPSVVSSYLPDSFWPRLYFLNIDVDVSSSWKGIGQESITIYQDFTGSDCFYPFEAEKEYLFYARHYGDTEVLVVLNCYGRTLDSSHASAQYDLATLQNYPQLPLTSSYRYDQLGVTALIILGMIYYRYSTIRKNNRQHTTPEQTPSDKYHTQTESLIDE